MAMEDVEIEGARLKAVRADFVTEEVQITIRLPLTGDTLAMRARLAALAMDGAPTIRVTLHPMAFQMPLTFENMGS